MYPQLCIRLVFNLCKYDHVSAQRSELKWLTIRQLHALTILISLLHFHIVQLICHLNLIIFVPKPALF